jgi:hypothetical protein
LSLQVFEPISSCLAFIPGSLLFIAVSGKIFPNLKLLEKIFFGSVFWLYLFISGTIIYDLIKQPVSNFFSFFSVLSLGVTVLALAYILRKNARHLTISVNLEKTSYLAILLPILLIFFVAIYYHTIFQEWDAITYYIPSAKAITLSNGINSQPYYLLNFFDTSPLIPALYSWVGISNFFSLYNLPLFFFALTVIVSYLISKEIFPNSKALLSTLIFVSLPVTLLTLSSRSLYLDISFVLFLLSALYSALRIVSFRHKGESGAILPYYLMFGISLTLMCLSRIEFGIILVPPILVTTLVAFQTRYWQILSTISLGAVIYLREVRNVLLNTASFYYHFQNLIPIVIVSVLFFIFLKVLIFDKPNTRVIKKESLLLIVTPSIPFLLLLARNFSTGFIIPQLPLTNAFITKSISTFSSIFKTPTSISVFSQPGNLLTVVWWLLSPCIIPAIISAIAILFSIRRKRFIEPKCCILLAFFVSCAILWITLGVDLQPRRLYYFAPFGALFVAFGLISLSKYFTKLGFIVRINFLVSSLFVLALFRINPLNVNNLALFYNNFAQLLNDYVFAISSVVLFIIIFLPYGRLIKFAHKKICLDSKIIAPLLLSIIIVNSALVLTVAYPIISTSFTKGDQLREQYFGGLVYYPEVVDYYNHNIKDNAVTVGFYCHELITFANRSIIDLSDPIYGSQIYANLRGMNESGLISKLNSLEVKYLLIPSTSSPYYSDYLQIINKTVFGNLFTDNPSFRVLHTFKYATLFKYSNNFTSKELPVYSIVPWTYTNLTNFETSLDNSAFNISGSSSTGFLSAMFELNSTEQIGNSLLLRIKSSSNATLRVQLFSDLGNTSTAFTTFQYPIDIETKQIIMDLSSIESSNGFRQSHVEGILVGLLNTHSNQSMFGVEQMYSLDYGD